MPASNGVKGTKADGYGDVRTRIALYSILSGRAIPVQDQPSLLFNLDILLKPLAMPATTSQAVKTGQHPPLHDLLRPYADFPKRIKGETVWRSEELKDKPESWTYGFNEDEIAELGTAADRILTDRVELTEITKVSTPILVRSDTAKMG